MEKQMEHYEEEKQREEPTAERPQVTFMGNNYDLTSLAAVISASILMLLCVSGNMGFYCLPVIPLVLGIVGLVTAKSSIDAERTRLFSWIGVGTGGVTLLLSLLLVLVAIAYFAFIAFVMMFRGG